jgi:hypothetical protein
MMKYVFTVLFLGAAALSAYDNSWMRCDTTNSGALHQGAYIVEAKNGVLITAQDVASMSGARLLNMIHWRDCLSSRSIFAALQKEGIGRSFIPDFSFSGFVKGGCRDD